MSTNIPCARIDCKKTIAFERPLCYKHWKEFDRFEISEYERCHWFDELVGVSSEDDLCYECIDRERRGYPPRQVHNHAPVERQVRYLYILKLDGGQYYVGQTNELGLRLKEHQDGLTASTKGRHPRLVWFEKWIGNRDELNDEESELTRLCKQNPRAIRRMVTEWQKLFRLVDFKVESPQ